ncbi:Pepsin inhibitor-3-like repeated domain family protein [Acanthocheilonema viteae]
MGIFARNSVTWLIIVSFDLSATLPASMPSSLTVIANGLVCTIVDGKIYVNNVYKTNATMENIEEVKTYNEKMREWTKSLHDTMYMTMKKMINDMFGDHGAFWRHLHGSFWEAVNAYGPDSDLMNPALVPIEQRKQQKKAILNLPELLPYPDPPSFCDHNME